MSLPFLSFSIQMYNYTIIFFQFSLPTSTQKTKLKNSLTQKKTDQKKFYITFWENKKIAGANFCTDRQTMQIFLEFCSIFKE